MSIIQSFIGTGLTISGGTVGGTTYVISAEALGEGSLWAFSFTATNAPVGTYYWTTSNTVDIQGTSGELGTIAENTGVYSFSREFTIIADNTTEGPETFTVSVRFGSIDGTIIVTSDPVTIDDTSQTPAPVPPFSLEFVQNEGDNLLVPASADFNLGTTWTIEFWLKANAPSSTAGGGIWGLLNQGGWSVAASIVVALSDNKLVFLSGSNSNDDVRYVEPTPGIWTHVAIVNNAGTQKVWYNGSEQAKVSGTFGTANYVNSTDPLRIGRLSPPNGGTLDGKMALVRVSNLAKYTTAFTPVTTYGVEDGSKLFLGTDDPLDDSVDPFRVITNTGTALSNDVPAVFAPLSLAFNGSTNYLDVVSGLPDFNLGTTWAMEFWSKATTSSTGNIFTVMSQVPDSNTIDVYYQDGNLVVNNGRTLCAEPTPSVWTHVALVCISTELNVYYNGVNVHTGGAYSVVDSTNSLNIGKRGQIPYQYFNGKLAMIRISNTAKYATAFTPTKTYGVDTDTVLFLGSAVPLIDSEGHITSNNGVIVSTDFPTLPQTFVALEYRQNSGYATNQGGNQISVLKADYPDFVNVPIGATVTITGQGSGTFTVTEIFSQTSVCIFNVNTLSFSVWGGDTLTFNWQA